MASSSVDNLFQQAKNTSQEEIDAICSEILNSLYEPSGQGLALLRQLFFILQASSTEPCIPGKFVATMVNMVSSMDRDKTKECLLCCQMMAELLPRDRKELGPDFYGDVKHIDPKSVANCFGLYVVQGNKDRCIEDLIPQAVKWMSSQNVAFEVQKHAFSFLIAISCLHNQLLQKDSVKETSNTLSSWLTTASLYQAPNPYTINPFKKDQNNVVTELDGTQSRNFFTVLNVGQYYTDDQFLNIYSFSMLYKWLYYSQSNQQGQGSSPREDSQEKRASPSLSSSLTKVYGALVNKTIDYCLRIMDQCERKPKMPSDIDLQNCCLLETINILNMVCKIDSGQVPKIFQEIRRLYNRLSQDGSKTRLLLPVLQFYINHSKAVIYDPLEAYKTFFHKTLSRGFTDPALTFDVLTFIRDNLETLCHDTNILSTYFPNILKILAWNPRSYITEFEEILPAMMTASTSVEIFHALLDLPCMTVALEVTEKFKNRSDAGGTLGSDTEPVSSVEAFQHIFYRPMFNFFTRIEGGHGDTISRLGSFHTILSDMSQHPRVIVCSQVVPVLLRLWFEVVFEEGAPELASSVIPVLLERTGLLFGIPEYKTDVKRIISENLVNLFVTFPTILIDQKTEILDFLMSVSNTTGREDFFANLVWAVGEMCSHSKDERCNTEIIKAFFDTLEPLTYEVSAFVSMATQEVTSGHAKIVSMLLSSIAKLSSRCQDLIPRAVLCFTKVAQQQQNSYQDSEVKEALVSRAQHLSNLLKVPNFAALVLNPSPEIHSGRWHRDGTALPTVLRGVHKIIVSDHS